MGKRRKGREVLLQACYAARMSGRTIQECLDEQLARRGCADETDVFARRLAALVITHEKAVLSWLGILLENWSINRLGVTEKILLQVTLTELRYCPDVPWRVAINESCELARRFCDEKAVGFVNGIVDKAAREIRSVDEDSAGGES